VDGMQTGEKRREGGLGTDKIHQKRKEKIWASKLSLKGILLKATKKYSGVTLVSVVPNRAVDD